MPLTPADVRNKQFSTTRLRPGYDEEEVDAFLDEVEAELDRLIQENEELRSKLAEVLRGGGKPAMGLGSPRADAPPAGRTRRSAGRAARLTRCSPRPAARRSRSLVTHGLAPSPWSGTR